MRDFGVGEFYGAELAKSRAGNLRDIDSAIPELNRSPPGMPLVVARPA